MPATSEAQRRLLNAKFGHEWVKAHHFDNKWKLPAHVKEKKVKKSKGKGINGHSMDAGVKMAFGKGSKHGHGKMHTHKGSHTPNHGGGKASSYHMGKNEKMC